MGGSVERHSHVAVVRHDRDGVTTRTDIHVMSVEDGDCFDPERCCDEYEREVIALMRNYLRPDQAPECLRRRLREMLDRCCGECD